MLWLLACVALALWAIDFAINNTRTMRTFIKIPGPKTLPIIGNLHQMPLDRVELFNSPRRLAAEFKNLYKFYLPPYRAINIYHPDDVEKVVSSTTFSEKSRVYDIMRPWLGDGLLLSAGEKHHQRRKILTPAFHFNILRHFHHILEENSRSLVDRLSSKESLDDVDLVPLIAEYSIAAICETAMGTKIDAEKAGEGIHYKDDIHQLADLMAVRVSRPYLMIDLLWKLTSNCRKQLKLIADIKLFPRRIISERRDYHEKFGDDVLIQNDETDDLHMSKKKKMAMLDLLLTAEKQGLIDEVGIREEVETFLFGGHDTTSIALTMTLSLIATHQEVQDKLLVELDELFGASNKPASMAQLQRLKYLDLVIKESLRLYPPAPFISRHLGESVQFSGYTVPSGTMCLIHIYDLHRRADFFEDPLDFRPERFLSDVRHPYAYIPFSAGQRSCIGQKLALLEMKSLVSAVLRKYRMRAITDPAEVNFCADVTLRPVCPVRVAFTPRTQ